MVVVPACVGENMDTRGLGVGDKGAFKSCFLVSEMSSWPVVLVEEKNVSGCVLGASVSF